LLETFDGLHGLVVDIPALGFRQTYAIEPGPTIAVGDTGYTLEIGEIGSYGLSFAAGNSGGDREMLEWAAAGDGPTLAVLVNHDDAEREFSYVSSAETFAEREPITDVGARLGWTVVSMADDWSTIFSPAT
jgi:hypothetical protein